MIYRNVSKDCSLDYDEVDWKIHTRHGPPNHSVNKSNMSSSVLPDTDKAEEDSGPQLDSQYNSCTGTLKTYTPSDVSEYQDVRPTILADDQIRLVHISRADSNKNAIVMRWKTTILEEAPAYNALSYTWGPPSRNPMQQMQEYQLTDNLVDCLSHISFRLPGLWWIDALCIIQNNLHEKRHQVKKMREVYASARKVYIWLGSEQDDGILALQILCKTYNHMQDGVIQNDRPQIKFCDGDLKHLELPATSEPAWGALVTFLSRPYFKRIWVLQELAAAKEEISFTCGSITLPYKVLHHTLCWMDTQDWKSALHNLATERNLSTDFGAFDLIDIVAVLSQFPREYDLNMYIGMCLGFKSSDPRDKIIALLGLVSPEDEAFKMIEPKYDQPVGDFFRDVTGTAIICYQSYELLSLVTLDSESTISNRPSWVPDFSLDRANQYHSECYHASGNTPLLVEWTLGSKTLSLQAKITDQVDIVSNNAGGSGETFITCILSWLAMAAKVADMDEWQWLSSLGDTQSSVDPQFDSFWRTLIGNKQAERDNMGSEAPDQYRWVFLAFIISSLLEQDQARAMQLMEAWAPSIDVEAQVLIPMGQGKHHVFGHQFMNSSLYKKFLITKQGRMALGPESLRPGDQVAIFSGGSSIYFVRETQSYYEFLGDGYVHGLMNGEGLRDDPSFQQISIQ